MRSELTAQYPRPPIGSVKTLARILGATPEQLQLLARREDMYRKAGSKQKADGTSRILWEAREPLKTIQSRITSRILQIVIYPAYLQGALPGKDYVSNAAVHAGKRCLISLDIAKFYPNCTAEIVHSIWRDFFHFPPEVVDLLTLLTTRNDSLPQGASPSSYLANLVFWNSEPSLVAHFFEQQLAYTRFVDDITVSSGRPVSRDMKAFIIKSAISMIAPKGFTLHRGKIQISDRAAVMTVHRLNVKSNRPTLLGRKRGQIRATVHSLEQLAKESRSGTAYRKAYLRARGQAALLKRFHAVEGGKLMDRVREIYPIASDQEVATLRRRVTKLSRISSRNRDTKLFTRNLSRVWQEIGELKRSRPGDAQCLRRTLKQSGL